MSLFTLTPDRDGGLTISESFMCNSKNKFRSDVLIRHSLPNVVDCSIYPKLFCVRNELRQYVGISICWLESNSDSNFNFLITKL